MNDREKAIELFKLGKGSIILTKECKNEIIIRELYTTVAENEICMYEDKINRKDGKEKRRNISTIKDSDKDFFMYDFNMLFDKAEEYIIKGYHLDILED